MPQVNLPILHPGQVRIFKNKSQLNRVRCGRRWGKTEFGKTIAGDRAIKGKSVGWFAPDYKIQSEAYNEILDMLDPVIKQSNKTEGRMETSKGGRIDFWSLENDRAGRSRKYHEVIIDEAAFAKANFKEIWERSIKPTLFDYGGRAWLMSTPNGTNPENFFYACAPEDGVGTNEFGFVDHHAPTYDNPLIPLIMPGETVEAWDARRKAEFEKLEKQNHPLVFRQEFKAEFVDWSGVAFFAADKWMGPDGQPLPWPDKCDSVFATVDTAVKDGKEHDGTAVIFWAVSRFHGAPLMILDWDIVQIEGAMLETWLPTIYQRLEQLALVCGARMGSLGAFIEDKASGTILLQQAARRGWPATPIDSRLTAAGKDEGAISISGYHYMGQVKLSAPAHDKVVTFKGQSRNHLMTQVLGYRIGDKDAAKRADDLFDSYRYGVSIALGDSNGY